jgi:short-subunit dehydrogenase
MEQIALITGASSGLGEEFARQLARRGGTLVLVARRLDNLEALRTELTAQYPDLMVFCVQADLARGDEVERVCNWIRDMGLEITLLVNNAGLGDHGTFDGSDWHRVKSMINVNVTALTRLTLFIVSGMRKRGSGAILNVSSVAGMIPLKKMAVYAATKAYVSSLSEAVRAELRGTGVIVTTLCPGPVETEFGEVAERKDSQDRMDAPEFFKVSKQRVVREALDGVDRDRPRVIPGYLVATAMVFLSSLPLLLIRMILARR